MFHPSLRAAALAALIAPSTAVACGGFFCSSSQLIAVEQKKERILFEVNPDDTLTIVVEIDFTGSPENFAWVLPVADTPTLDVVPRSALRLLDAATTPQLIPPSIWRNWDEDSPTGDDDDVTTGDDDDVVVEELPQVGPFEATVVSSDDPQALIDWLNDNDYLITESMEPMVAGYVAQGMKFLGLKLAPGESVQSISPIQATYPGTAPSIPLTLTGVSAEPEMSFLVFIAGADRYAPANWSDLEVPTELLQADPRTGANNYFPLVSYLSDLEGGRAFFTEHAQTTEFVQQELEYIYLGADDEEEARAWFAELASRQPYLTRLFARASADELTTDPIFAPVSWETVDGIHQLGAEVCWDFEHTPVVLCDETYCGVGGVCGVGAAGEEGCDCGVGSLARPITAPNLSAVGAFPSVTCEDASVDMMAGVSGPVPMDPCEDRSCGDFGTCVVHDGMPTCDCNDGFIAVPDEGHLRCVLAVETFAPEQVLWPEWPPSTEGCGDDDDSTPGDDDSTAAGDDDGDDDESEVRPPPACATGAPIGGSSWTALLLLGLLPTRRVRRAEG